MRRPLLTLLTLGLALTFGVGTPRCAAQPADSLPPSALPLRNVLIEVRIESERRDAHEQMGAQVQAPPGSDAELALQADRRRSEQSGLSQQQVLVLNGRAAALLRVQSVPLRLRQLVTIGGVQRLVPGTIWLQGGSTLLATPLWDGGDRVYLELSASEGRGPLEPSASARTTLLLPLEQWITVAESEDELQDARAGLGTGGAFRQDHSGSGRLRVQVRLTLR